MTLCSHPETVFCLLKTVGLSNGIIFVNATTLLVLAEIREAVVLQSIRIHTEHQ